MWLDAVDLPDEVVSAHQEGRLVLFVGAGASMPPPSNLMSFYKLTREIADRADYEWREGDDERLDRVLGAIETELRVDVHRRIAALVGSPDSQPNAVHAAVARIAASGTCRIVTTNYDLHLNRSLDLVGWTGRTYRAPALPIGDDFEGVVYLHGALDDEHRRLVATDADFGRGYLSDAWATRFLDRMFSQYVVLFVGYSHDDVVMSYLARGLRPGTRRYALTPDSGGNWSMLGITPVPYPLDDAHPDHVALPDALSAWADLTGMGMLDHDQRLREITASPPPLDPPAISYLHATVADTARLGVLLRHADSVEWLAWVSALPRFARLCQPVPPGADDETADDDLARWFADQVVRDGERTAVGLRAVQAAGGSITAKLWWHLALALERVEQAPSPPFVSTWLHLLLADADRNDSRLLGQATRRAGRERRWIDLTAAVDTLLSPRLVPFPVPGLGSGLDVDVAVDQHVLADVVSHHVVPNLPVLADAVITLCDRNLRRAHALNHAIRSDGFDSNSFKRSAIEAHEQDAFVPEAFNVLVDLARDTLSWLLRHRPDAGQAWLDSWERADAPLLRRLAINGWSHRQDRTPDERIAWLIGTNFWLADTAVHHETYELLARHVAKCSQHVTASLVEAAFEYADTAADTETTPGADTDIEHRDHSRRSATRLLLWAADHDPRSAELRSAASWLADGDQHWMQESPHPDLLAWMSSGPIVTPELMSVTELHTTLGQDPVAAVHELRRRATDADWRHFDDPVTAAVSALVATYPRDGFTVLDAETPTPPDTLEGAVRGWTISRIGPADTRDIATRLSTSNIGPAAWAVATMLLRDSGDQDDLSPTFVDSHDGMTIAEALTADLAAGTAPADIVGATWSAALNNPEGKLVQFWLLTISARWQATEDTWAGIPQRHRAGLEAALALPGAAGRVALTRLAGETSFLYSADPTWTTDHLLPALTWKTDPDSSADAWQGYLRGSAVNKGLLLAGLLDGYVDASRNIPDPDTRRQLARHLAIVGVESAMDGAPTLEWARSVTNASDPELRTLWFDAIADLLDHLPHEAVAHLWSEWLEPYWRGRIETVPTALLVEENSALATWLPFLGPAIPAAAQLVCEAPAGPSLDRFFLRKIDDALIDQYPSEICRVVAHLVGFVERRTFWAVPDTQRIYDLVKSRVDASDSQNLKEAAVRRGLSEAAEW